MQTEEAKLPQYDIEDFLDDVMYKARDMAAQINPLHPAQMRHVWDRLIREIEDERDGR